MRRVVRSREVYHLWANAAQDEARNANASVSFHNNDAYSYGTIIGRIERNDAGDVCYIVSNRSYSNTTAKHQSMLRHSIGWVSSRRVFHVAEVAPGGWNRNADTSHAARLEEYLASIAEAEGKAKRARSNKDYWLGRVVSLTDEATAYCAFFGLDAVFTPETVERLRLERAEAIARAEANARQARAEADAQLRAEYAEDVDDWRYHGGYLPYGYPDVLLRVNGEMIETSKGATVPIHHARRLFLAWLNGSIAEGDRVGHYTVARIENGTALQVGCHYITRDEADRIAHELGWLSNTALSA